MKLFTYVRIYFERANGRVVLDSGPGTQRMEVATVEIDGHTVGEHGPASDRPRFWMAARHAAVRVVNDVAYVATGG